MDAERKNGDDIFECQKCGECCNGFGGTYITRKDIINICRFIKSEQDIFIKKYCDPSGSRYVLTRGPDGYCIFFDKSRQCTIHPVKPYMCRAWPFIRTLLHNPENWNTMANSCPGMKKGVAHQTIKKITADEKKKLDSSFT